MSETELLELCENLKNKIVELKNKDQDLKAHFKQLKEYCDGLEEEEAAKIVKRKKLELKPIDEEEAIIEMEMLGHSFFVYRDVDTDEICILYKRKNGNYGIIETK